MTPLYILMWIGDVALFFSYCLNTCSGFSGSGELFKNMNTHGDFTPHRVVLPLRAIPPAQDALSPPLRIFFHFTRKRNSTKLIV
jgi:hypothetical protein